MKSVKPRGLWALIELAELAQSKGPIDIPPSVQKERQKDTGIIVHAGDCTRWKKGEHVIFKKWKGEEVKLNGKPHLLVAEEDILAVIE